MAIFAVSVEIGKVNTTTAVKIGRPISASNYAPVQAKRLRRENETCQEQRHAGGGSELVGHLGKSPKRGQRQREELWAKAQGAVSKVDHDPDNIPHFSWPFIAEPFQVPKIVQITVAPAFISKPTSVLSASATMSISGPR